MNQNIPQLFPKGVALCIDNDNQYLLDEQTFWGTKKFPNAMNSLN